MCICVYKSDNAGGQYAGRWLAGAACTAGALCGVGGTVQVHCVVWEGLRRCTVWEGLLVAFISRPRQKHHLLSLQTFLRNFSAPGCLLTQFRSARNFYL